MRISDWSSDVCSSDLVANLFDRAHARVDANEIGLARAVIIVGADCKVGAFKRFTEFAIGNAIASKKVRVALDYERLGLAADRIDPGNIAARLTFRAHDRVLDLSDVKRNSLKLNQHSNEVITS